MSLSSIVHIYIPGWLPLKHGLLFFNHWAGGTLAALNCAKTSCTLVVLFPLSTGMKSWPSFHTCVFCVYFVQVSSPIGYMPLGYKVIPDNIRIKAMFYYRVIMEELSDRCGDHRWLMVSDTNLKPAPRTKRLSTTWLIIIANCLPSPLPPCYRNLLAKALQQQQPVISKKVGHHR